MQNNQPDYHMCLMGCDGFNYQCSHYATPLDGECCTHYNKINNRLMMAAKCGKDCSSMKSVDDILIMLALQSRPVMDQL